MHSRRTTGTVRLVGVALTGLLAIACVRNPPPPVEPEAPEPPPTADRSTTRTPPPAPPPPRPSPPVIEEEDPFASRSLEELNRESPLEPAFFAYDSSEISSSGRSTLEKNAEVLKRYPTWVITIEGHCDERGTPEYNLGLGERRAMVAREYLVELGLDLGRIRTVSYGKEFPFDPGSNEQAHSRNRRAHFVITEK
jgi:peptidoglycan-associated lipoprotein